MGSHIPSGPSVCTHSPFPEQARKPFQGQFLAGKHLKAGSDIKRVPQAGGCTPVHPPPCRKGLSTHHIPNSWAVSTWKVWIAKVLPGVLEKPPGYHSSTDLILIPRSSSELHSQECSHGSCWNAPGKSFYCFPVTFWVLDADLKQQQPHNSVSPVEFSLFPEV